MGNIRSCYRKPSLREGNQSEPSTESSSPNETPPPPPAAHDLQQSVAIDEADQMGVRIAVEGPIPREQGVEKQQSPTSSPTQLLNRVHHHLDAPPHPLDIHRAASEPADVGFQSDVQYMDTSEEERDPSFFLQPAPLDSSAPPRPSPSPETISAELPHTRSGVAAGTNRQGQKQVNQYIMSEDHILGSGSYGSVLLARSTRDHQLYAVKIIDKTLLRRRQVLGRTGKKDQLALVRREIAIMKKLSHPNIVRLVEVLDDTRRDKLYIVLEYMPRGSVMKGELEVDPLPEPLVRRYMRHLIAGMMYLHENHICHRDIKPENLLVSEEGVLKISDFGVSQMFGDDPGDDICHDSAGTAAFMPPEMVGLTQEVAYSAKLADVWGMGVTLYVMALGEYPFEAPTIPRMFEAIVEKPLAFPDELLPAQEASQKEEEEAAVMVEQESTAIESEPRAGARITIGQESWTVPQKPVRASEDLKDLIRKILQKEPSQRISLHEMANHPWITLNGRWPFHHPDIMNPPPPLSDDGQPSSAERIPEDEENKSLPAASSVPGHQELLAPPSPAEIDSAVTLVLIVRRIIFIKRRIRAFRRRIHERKQRLSSI